MTRTDAVLLLILLVGCSVIVWLKKRPSTTKTEPKPRYRGWLHE